MKNIFCKSIIVWIVCTSFLIRANGQSIDETFTLALKQYAEGNYDYASELAQRVTFFDTDYKYIPGCDLLVAKCYMQKKEYALAANFFEKAFSNNTNDSIRTECLFDKASCHLLQREYNFALTELLTIRDKPLQPNTTKKKNLFLAVTYYYLNEFELSKLNLLAIDNLDSLETKKIDQLFLQNDKLTKRYKPKTARIMSLIIPGSGQLYAGDYKNGINSFLLVAAFTYLGYTVVVNGTIADAIISILPWLQRYYYGSSQKAEIICRDKLQYERNKLIQNYLKQL
jgi:tetratricopeptide (TPR) repeat protein